MVRAHDAENDTERERLRALVGRLGAAELSRPMPGGWTVAAVLAHVGFWDARAIAFYDTWSRGDAPDAAYYETEETDWENDSVKPLCLALQPRHAAQVAVRLAEQADATVAALSDEQLTKILAAGGPPLNLSRAAHRKEHLDDIERVLATPVR